ncbi:uncharacterized protein M6B38_340750 [Iris pallida]|uniref:Uncharacterized protein n=1 Tax=Iris pallida TaxID=29817 RepID=A0AAX6GX62_IRIPA|nr:uncharacterized protein M6B38_340750 [Iris pallida]
MGGDGGNDDCGMVMASAVPPSNPLVQLQARFKEVEAGFRSWLAKQPLAVEAVVVTATGATQGAAIGELMGTLTVDVAVPPPTIALNPQAMASFKQGLPQASQGFMLNKKNLWQALGAKG